MLAPLPTLKFFNLLSLGGLFFVLAYLAKTWLQLEPGSVTKGEGWRLLTFSVTHINLEHLLLNLGGMVCLLIAFKDKVSGRELLGVTAGAILALGFYHLLLPPTITVSGASGALHAIAVFGAIRLPGFWRMAWLLGIILKLVVEQLQPAVAAPFVVMTEHHLIGALVGGALGIKQLSSTTRRELGVT